MDQNMRPSKSGCSNAKETEGRGQTKRGRGTDDDGWGGFRNYMQAKKSKLDDQFDKDNKGKSSQIFAGIHIYVNGYTRPSSDELRRIMQRHGGRYEMYLSMKRVTHIVASNLPNSKFKMARTMPIVKPDWITDSVNAGRRLSHVPYLLLGNQSKLQPGLKSFPSVSCLSKSSSTSSTTLMDGVAPVTATPTMPSITTALADTTNSGLSETDRSHTYRNSAGLAEAKVHGHQDNNYLTIHSTDRILDHGDSFSNVEGNDEGSMKHDNVCLTDQSKHCKSETLLSASTGEPKLDPECQGFHKDNGRESGSDDDIVYNSESDDDGDDNIVYNSEEDSKDVSGFDATSGISGKTQTNFDQNPVKRSRVYSLRKMKLSKSGSFDSMRSDNSSCDGFSDCLHSEQQASSQERSIVNAPFITRNIPTSRTTLPNSAKIMVSSAVSSPASVSSTTTPPQFSTVHSGTIRNNVSPMKGVKSSEATQSAISMDHKTPGTPAPVQQYARNILNSSGGIDPQDATGKTLTKNVCTGVVSLQKKLQPETSGSLVCSISSKVVAKQTGPSSLGKADTALAKPSSSTMSPKKQGGMMARAGDKGFLEEFYSNSRLHHLSTWGAEFKAYVSEIQRTGVPSFPGREKLRQSHVEAVTRVGLAETLDSSRHSVSGRVVMHIDMDCFFVSVGLLNRPDLKGKPVAVTHSKGQGSKQNPSSSLAWEQAEWRKMKDSKLKGEKPAGASTFDDTGTDEQGKEGYDFLVPKGSTGAQTFHSMAEIASCSYEARKAGVKNGMFMGRAMQLCPDLQTIPYNFSEYNRISKVLYDLVASYTLDIEAVSCDEMLIDCTDVLTDTGATATEFASLLRSEMMEKTGCPASTGIGPNILLAKLATRRAKPNGQFEVTNSEAKKFIEDQPVSDLPGVGYSMTRKLSKLDVQTCGQLQRVALSTLRREFGPKTGEGLHKFSIGQDDRPVKGDKQRKSVSAEVNYGIRFSKDLDALTFLKELCGEVKRRLDAIQVKGRSITLKLMVRRPDAPAETAKFMGHGICNTINKSSNLPVATNDEDLIAREIISLYKSQKVISQDVRGIGIQINKLEGYSNSHGLSNVKGHQSILNFAIPSTSKTNDIQNVKERKEKSGWLGLGEPKNDSGAMVPEAVQDAVPGTSAKSLSTERTLTPSLFSSTSQSSSSSLSKSFTPKNHSTPQRSSAAGQSGTPLLSFPSSSHNTSNGGHITITSVTDMDTSHDTFRGRERTLHSAHTSELSLERPEFVQPGPSKDPSHQIAVAGPSTSRSEQQPQGFLNLSLSQIDSDTLKELPEDIAKEIIDGLTRQRQHRSDPHNSQEADGNLNRHGREHRQISAQTDVEEALPSFSQLNMSCFEALPADLQQEIIAEYVWLEKKAAGKSHQNVEENYFTRLTSPRKDQRNHGLTTGRGTGRRGRRGRPPGKRKLNFPGNRIRKSEALTLRKVTRVTFPEELDVIVCEDDDKRTNDGNYLADQENRLDCINDKFSNPSYQTMHHGDAQAAVNDRYQPKQVQQATLCGAVTLEDVRALLKEWLLSGPEPQSDDLTLVTEYLTLLVEQRNLEVAFSLLKLIHRKSMEVDHQAWRDCLENLVSLIQGLVCASHGAYLKL